MKEGLVPADKHPTGKPPEMRSRTENRIWEKVDYFGRGDDECWEWQAATGHGDHGMISYDGGTRHAHRVLYAMLNDTHPDDIDGIICHKCHNPRCCNPRHLYLGDRADNMRDAIKDGSVGRLTRDDVADIINRAETGETQVSIAQDYGISDAMVSLIVRGKVYEEFYESISGSGRDARV